PRMAVLQPEFRRACWHDVPGQTLLQRDNEDIGSGERLRQALLRLVWQETDGLEAHSPYFSLQIRLLCPLSDEHELNVWELSQMCGCLDGRLQPLRQANIA